MPNLDNLDTEIKLITHILDKGKYVINKETFLFLMNMRLDKQIEKVNLENKIRDDQ